MVQEADADMVRMNFFGFGYQYYLAGRYAVAAQLLPIAANLLHHAIEMLLKGEADPSGRKAAPIYGTRPL